MFTSTLTDAAPDTPNAYLANGVIGLSVPRSPLQSGEMRVNGCFGLNSRNDTEWIALLPFPFGLDLSIEHIPLIEHGASLISQKLDFSCGELVTECVYSVADIEVELAETLLCSRANPAIALRRLTIRTSRPCKVRLRAHIDADSVPGEAISSGSPVHEADSLLHWQTEGGLSSCGIALVTTVSSGTELSRRPFERLSTFVEVNIGGEAVEVTQIAAIVPGILHEEPQWQALRLLRSAIWRGADDIAAESRLQWSEIWKSRIILRGAGDEWQRLADAAYFYLFSSGHRAAPCSIPPFALSASGYGGHIFWDTETFMYPVFLLAAPDIAESLIRYRTDRLATAETNARINGYSGAMFPWESGMSGAEVTPVYASTSEEHHITMDVAFACIQHAHASGNSEFVRRAIWPLLDSVCRWIVSRVVRTSRGYEIHHVVGVDESTENIDNNSYTNIAAKVVLEESGKLAAGLGVTPPGSWSEIANGIFIPLDEKLGIILKHDSYTYNGGPCVPETLGAFFPFTYRHPDAAIESRTYKYHIDLAETVLHYPMLSSLFGVWAARQGDREFALRCFQKGIQDFVCKPHYSFSEFRGADIPLFLTNPAGFLTACLYGLTGIQLDGGDPQDWGKFPVVMPAGWDGVEVEQIWIGTDRRASRQCMATSGPRLSGLSRRVHTDRPRWKDGWESARHHFEEWWAGSGTVLTFTGLPPLSEPRDRTEPPGEPNSHAARFTDPDWFARNEHHRLAFERFPADTLPIAHVDYGCVQLGAVFGAEPDFDAETVWYTPRPDEPEDYGELVLHGTERWWQVHQQVAERVLEFSRGNYIVGAPALGSNLDVLAALRGSQDLLFDLVDRPDWVTSELAEINSAFFAAFDRYYEQIRLADGSSAYAYFHIWGEGKVSQVQCDFSAMISPAMFDRFVVPSLSQQCSWLDRALYHLDGPDCIRHLDRLLQVSDLHAVQWTPGAGEPGPGDPKWYFIYDRILRAGKSIQALQVSVEEARSLFERYGTAGLYVSVETDDLSEVESLIEFVDAKR